MAIVNVREITVSDDGELHLKGLPFRTGDRVEVLLIRRTGQAAPANRYPLHDTPLRYDTPFEPAAEPDDWEANR